MLSFRLLQGAGGCLNILTCAASASASLWFSLPTEQSPKISVLPKVPLLLSLGCSSIYPPTSATPSLVPRGMWSPLDFTKEQIFVSVLPQVLSNSLSSILGANSCPELAVGCSFTDC